MSIDAIQSLPVPPLLEILQKSGYARASRVPAFPTRQVCPLQDLWVERRLHQGRPVALATHSRPSRFFQELGESQPYYRAFYLHEEVAELPQSEGWLQDGKALWQVASVDQSWVVSSIQGRSPGEFIYLGDDSGLLIERARELWGNSARGRACDMACGCGVIGQNLPAGFREVIGLDAVPEAVALAQLNARLNQSSAQYRVSDLWSEASGQFDFVIGNPPALPLQQDLQHLRYAYGGANPASLTVGVVEGLPRHLAPGGVCLLLSFSVRDLLWEQLQAVLPSDYSLRYQPRRRIVFGDSELGWMEHVWIEIRRDARGQRIRAPRWWDRLINWSWPGSQGETPLQCAYAGNQRSPERTAEPSSSNL